ncbi:MAG: hypothetical protein LBP79_07665 [Clostridiales bacterium]|jgi:DNA-directed RNA polymerase specialized sigma24 family protein|nr:hypothetical protein [Clostridiales bacterium]
MNGGITVEFLLKYRQKIKIDSVQDGTLKEMSDFLDFCVASDTSDGGAVIRALYFDGKSYRRAARALYLSRGAVEYKKKKAVLKYADSLENRFRIPAKTEGDRRD